MKEYENDCVDCGLPCLGSECPNRRVPHYYCDECGEEAKLYKLDGNEYCANCVLLFLDVVEGSE